MVMTCDYDVLKTDDDGDSDLHPSHPFNAVSTRNSTGANVRFCDSHAESGKTNRWQQSSD